MYNAPELGFGENGNGILHGIRNIDVLAHGFHRGNFHGKAAQLVGCGTQNEQQAAVLVVLEHPSGFQIQTVDASHVVNIDVHHLGGVVLIGGGIINRVQITECRLQHGEQVIAGRVDLFHTVRLGGGGLCDGVDEALIVNVKTGDACRHVTGGIRPHFIGGDHVPEVVRHHFRSSVHGVGTEIALKFAVAVEHGRAVGDIVQHHVDIARLVHNDFLGLKGLVFI